MSSRLYKLALWYIKKCNAKWENRHKEKVESLTRLTYWNFGKYMLLYGADAEWQIFGRYDVLDNAIQRLGEYENIGTVEEFKALKENKCKCEAYDKEKHYCPKFCKVIKETVKEIEDNHNIKGKWEITYKGKRKSVNTGLMISAYNCKCSVCGWETGNQGTRFNYCPNCGAKMDEVNKMKGE